MQLAKISLYNNWWQPSTTSFSSWASSLSISVKRQETRQTVNSSGILVKIWRTSLAEINHCEVICKCTITNNWKKPSNSYTANGTSLVSKKKSVSASPSLSIRTLAQWTQERKPLARCSMRAVNTKRLSKRLRKMSSIQRDRSKHFLILKRWSSAELTTGLTFKTLTTRSLLSRRKQNQSKSKANTEWVSKQRKRIWDAVWLSSRTVIKQNQIKTTLE